MPDTDTRHPIALRQLAETVVHGRKVAFFVEGDRHEGYLAGFDADTFFFLVPPTRGDDVKQFLVPRTPQPILEISGDSTYERENWHRKMERVIRPFRQYVQGNILSATESKG